MTEQMLVIELTRESVTDIALYAAKMYREHQSLATTKLPGREKFKQRHAVEAQKWAIVRDECRSVFEVHLSTEVAP